MPSSILYYLYDQQFDHITRRSITSLCPSQRCDVGSLFRLKGRACYGSISGSRVCQNDFQTRDLSTYLALASIPEILNLSILTSVNTTIQSTLSIYYHSHHARTSDFPCHCSRAINQCQGHSSPETSCREWALAPYQSIHLHSYQWLHEQFDVIQLSRQQYWSASRNRLLTLCTRLCRRCEQLLSLWQQ